MEPTKRISELLEKYWRADTNEDEEKELQEYFALHPEVSDHPAAAMFGYIRAEQQVQSAPKTFRVQAAVKKIPVTRRWYAAAAAAAAILVIVIAVTLLRPRFEPSPPQFSQVDTYTDARQAYAETKKAMLLLSVRMNKAQGYISEIGRIDKAERIIYKKTKRS